MNTTEINTKIDLIINELFELKRQINSEGNSIPVNHWPKPMDNDWPLLQNDHWRITCEADSEPAMMPVVNKWLRQGKFIGAGVVNDSFGRFLENTPK